MEETTLWMVAGVYINSASEEHRLCVCNVYAMNEWSACLIARQLFLNELPSPRLWEQQTLVAHRPKSRAEFEAELKRFAFSDGVDSEAE